MSVSFEIKIINDVISFIELELLCDEKLFTSELTSAMNESDKANFVFEDNKLYRIGNLNKSGWGFDFKVVEGYYNIRVYTPSSIGDWSLAIKMLSKLSRRESSRILCENGSEYNYQTIYEFNYYQYIEDAIKNLTGISEHYGINYIQYLDDEIVEGFLNSDDVVRAYSDFITECQWINYYPAKQAIYKRKNRAGYMSSYTLTTGVDTILPAKVILESKYISRGLEVREYNIGFFDYRKGKVVGVLDYEVFLKHLPKDNFYYIDAINIALKAMSSEEISQLIIDAQTKKEEPIPQKKLRRFFRF